MKYFIKDQLNKVKVLRDQLIYKFHGGFKCKCCGKIIPTRGDRIDGEVNGKRMIFHSWHSGARCSQCTYDELMSWYIVQDWETESNSWNGPRRGVCDWTGQEEFVIRFVPRSRDDEWPEYDLHISFGHNSWNGSWAGPGAFDELLNCTGKYTSDIFRVRENRMIHMIGPYNSIEVKEGQNLSVK